MLPSGWDLVLGLAHIREFLKVEDFLCISNRSSLDDHFNFYFLSPGVGRRTIAFCQPADAADLNRVFRLGGRNTLSNV